MTASNRHHQLFLVDIQLRTAFRQFACTEPFFRIAVTTRILFSSHLEKNTMWKKFNLMSQGSRRLFFWCSFISYGEPIQIWRQGRGVVAVVTSILAAIHTQTEMQSPPQPSTHCHSLLSTPHFQTKQLQRNFSSHWHTTFIRRILAKYFVDILSCLRCTDTIAGLVFENNTIFKKYS